MNLQMLSWKKRHILIPITRPLLHRRTDKMKVRRRKRGQILKMEIEPWSTWFFPHQWGKNKTALQERWQIFNLKRENSGLLMIKWDRETTKNWLFFPSKRKRGSPMVRGIIGRTDSDVHVQGDEGAWSAFISHWFTQSQSPPNISSVLHLQSPIHRGHEPLPMAGITAWWPPQSNEIERSGKWETGQAGRRWRRKRRRRRE